MKDRLTALILALFLLFTNCLPAASAEWLGQRQSEGARDYRVMTRGGGEDTVTIMVYLDGSDLETNGGAASADLREMMAADISDNVNLIVETGGSSEWHISDVNPETNQRWRITQGNMELVDDAGFCNMVEPETLTNFIRFCATNYPADRYMLVLWNHGGGTVGGFGDDERFILSRSDTLSISEINQVLADSGVVFDMIGFDACLMATAETAFMVEKYADYMIASQRNEPGSGWNYTPWLNALSANTSIPTAELGAIVVDSFIEDAMNGYSRDQLTLSVIDLTYIPTLFEEMYEFFDNAEYTLISDNGFLSVAQAITSNRAVSDNYDLVDIEYLLGSMEGSDEVLEILDQCVVYNNTTIDDHNGLCLYFPYTDLSSVDFALDIYDQIGIDDSYQSFITTFANIMAGGQMYASTEPAQPHSALATVLAGNTAGDADESYDAPDEIASTGNAAIDNLIAHQSGANDQPDDTGDTSASSGGGHYVIESLILHQPSIDTAAEGAQPALGFSEWLSASWMDETMQAGLTDFYSAYSYDTTQLEIDEYGDEYVLSIPDEQWHMITAVEQCVYLDDGGGYIELGADSMYEFTAEGDLLISFDNTWVSLDDQLVCFYTVENWSSGDEWYSWGVAPIWYNNRDAELVVRWDNEHPSGYVMGWRYAEENNSTNLRGLFELEEGMYFDFLCEYYDYEGEHLGSYLWGGMTVSGDISVSYEDVGDGDVIVYYELRDIFQNVFTTESVIYSLNN